MLFLISLLFYINMSQCFRKIGIVQRFMLAFLQLCQVSEQTLAVSISRFKPLPEFVALRFDKIDQVVVLQTDFFFLFFFFRLPVFLSSATNRCNLTKRTAGTKERHLLGSSSSRLDRKASINEKASSRTGFLLSRAGTSNRTALLLSR